MQTTHDYLDYDDKFNKSSFNLHLSTSKSFTNSNSGNNFCKLKDETIDRYDMPFNQTQLDDGFISQNQNY